MVHKAVELQFSLGLRRRQLGRAPLLFTYFPILCCGDKAYAEYGLCWCPRHIHQQTGPQYGVFEAHTDIGQEDDYTTGFSYEIEDRANRLMKVTTMSQLRYLDLQQARWWTCTNLASLCCQELVVTQLWQIILLFWLFHLLWKILWGHTARNSHQI